MRVVVNKDVCELHGQCFSVAPDVFGFRDDGVLEYRDHVDGKLARDAAFAAIVCPSGAITIEPDEPVQHDK